MSPLLPYTTKQKNSSRICLEKSAFWIHYTREQTRERICSRDSWNCSRNEFLRLLTKRVLTKRVFLVCSRNECSRNERSRNEFLKLLTKRVFTKRVFCQCSRNECSRNECSRNECSRNKFWTRWKINYRELIFLLWILRP